MRKVPAKPLKAQMNRWGRKNSPGKADSDGLEEEPGGKRADAADTPSAGAEPAGEDSGTSGGSSSNSGERSPSGPAADLQSKDLTGRKILFFRTAVQQDRQITQIQIEKHRQLRINPFFLQQKRKMTKLWTKKRNRKEKEIRRRRTEKASLAPDHPLDYHSADRLHHSRRSLCGIRGLHLP